MNWIPVIGIVVGAKIAFDIYRAFDPNGFWGQPWPRIKQRDDAFLFWMLQTLRIIVSAGLIVIGALWLTQ